MTSVPNLSGIPSLHSTSNTTTQIVTSEGGLSETEVTDIVDTAIAVVETAIADLRHPTRTAPPKVWLEVSDTFLDFVGDSLMTVKIMMDVGNADSVGAFSFRIRHLDSIELVSGGLSEDAVPYWNTLATSTVGDVATDTSETRCSALYKLNNFYDISNNE
eukprot:3066097-Pleurochrysis_carterae.AAC.1